MPFRNTYKKVIRIFSCDRRFTPGTCLRKKYAPAALPQRFFTGKQLRLLKDQRSSIYRERMMNEVMNGGGSMMWGMGWGGLLVVVLVVLGIAALAKYMFFDKR
jgi:hypothetical protein